ncbi:MAG: hypothetical protein WCJ30_12265 [Deltaproteobacteria bacterium]
MEPREEQTDVLEPAAAADAGAKEISGAVPALERLGRFSLGPAAATATTLLALLRPWRHERTAERALPYETFPFADNAGVCQEWVAMSSLQTSHEDAVATVRRITPSLPADVHADNLRIVRAFAPGDYWSVAVDAQPGAGDEARARAVAALMNALPGEGLRFEPVYYSSRRLYDTAHVLCMPRANVVQ